MRESELHEHIYRRTTDLTARFPHIQTGPGDDGAVVRTPARDRLTITTDQLVEGRHFESALLATAEGLDLVARKAVARSISDLAAMGASPAWSLATALLPDGFAAADALFDRMHAWANHWQCPLIGGDIASLGQNGALSLTVTCAGSFGSDATPRLRSGARPCDSIWLTGPIGGSVTSGKHLQVEPRVEAGLAAAKSDAVTAMIDISDGLGRDAARIGQASGVVLEIEAARIPLADQAGDWRSAAIEGEDYELLLTATGDEPPFGPVAGLPLLGPIGRVAPAADAEPGTVIVDDTGHRHAANDMGWDH